MWQSDKYIIHVDSICSFSKFSQVPGDWLLYSEVEFCLDTKEHCISKSKQRTKRTKCLAQKNNFHSKLIQSRNMLVEIQDLSNDC